MTDDGDRIEQTSATSLKSIEEHAAVYAAVVASALDAVIVVDEMGIVVTINPAAEATFGFGRDEAMGRPIGELIVPDHLRQAHENGLARYRATRQPHVLGRRVEMEARRKDGRIIPVELAITEVNLSDRRLFTANLRDLSAARDSQAEIERQRDALHQSEKLAALGSLLAGVAHELNNPLSIVLGQATMLREDVDDSEASAAVRARVEGIETAAERCARVVRSFLSIARQRKAEKRAVALAPLLDGAVDLMLYSMQSGGISVTRDYDDESLPEILADPDLVQQVVVNLLANATQALEEVEGRREIRVSASAAAGGKVNIVVADNGPGVPSEIAPRIFDPFFTTKPQGAGTGIGLSVSRGLAEAHGGDLRLLDSLPDGAAFELSLPAAAGTENIAADRSANGADADLKQTGEDRLTRRAIVVDDEAEIAVLLADALRRVGYKCDVATGGREAQAMIAANPGGYDAAICDLRMPDIDGPRLFRWMANHYPELAERTLFVTGDALGAAAGRFLAESRRPVLEKPFTPADVVRLVAGFPPRFGANGA